jgi:ribosomal subunit interface protein
MGSNDMHFRIQTRNVEISRTFEEWIERRLWFALAKFGGRIRRITALLEDINGPRGGVDQRCRVEVHLVPSGKIEAEATNADAVLAVSRATDRIARRVRDAVERRRARRVRARAHMPDDSGA